MSSYPKMSSLTVRQKAYIGVPYTPVSMSESNITKMEIDKETYYLVRTSKGVNLLLTKNELKRVHQRASRYKAYNTLKFESIRKINRKASEAIDQL